ncbi:MAG: hypothetical protein JNL58_09420 [Planctomyces sp.]|nr:hypothetical protein [Planctomyces sp.]
MRGPGSPPGLLFRLVVPATAVFIVTILSLIAVLFSDERAPLAKFLNRNGNSLLAVEFVVIIVLAILAMIVDRRQILRDQQRPREESALQPSVSESSSSGEPDLPSSGKSDL